jgi:hypothetical protein
VKREPACLRCQSPMIEGQVVAPPNYRGPLWFDGVPKVGWFGIPKVKVSDASQVRSFRCPKCGYVELNAGR